MNPMEAIPLHRTTIIRPFIQYLTEIGAPVNRILRQFKMPTLAIDDPDYYISSVAFWAFVEKMAAKEGIENLCFLVGKRAGAKAVDPNYSKLLSYSPTLYHALIKTCRVASAEISRTIMSVSHTHTDRGTTRFCHQTSFGIEHPNHHRMEWFAIMAMIGIIREFSGPLWLPKTIGLMSYQLPDSIAREHFPDCQFLNGQTCGFVGIETPLLSLPPLANCNNKQSNSKFELVASTLGEPAVDFIGSLKQVLRGYLGEGTPHISLAAEIAGTSIRSLQRELAKSKLTYLDLLAQLRFDTATRYFEDEAISINEIAYHLGYNDASHFTRAFRRLAGMSPSQYRKALKSQVITTAKKRYG
jgi:AraC-like DNA-binding protein